jgi:hypothetical protein
MATLNDFERLLPTLSRGEKAQILKWVVQDLGDDFPSIDPPRCLRAAKLSKATWPVPWAARGCPW